MRPQKGVVTPPKSGPRQSGTTNNRQPLLGTTTAVSGGSTRADWPLTILGVIMALTAVMARREVTKHLLCRPATPSLLIVPTLFVSSSIVRSIPYNPRRGNVKVGPSYIHCNTKQDNFRKGNRWNHVEKSTLLWLSSHYRGGMQQQRSHSDAISSGDNKSAKETTASNGSNGSNGTLTKDETFSIDSSLEQTTLSSSSSLSSSKTGRRSRLGRALRRGMGSLLSGVGFVSSTVVSLATDPQSFQTRFGEPIRALRKFLKTSGVDVELSAGLNRRLGINMCLLGRVHMHQGAQEDEDRQKERHRQHGTTSTVHSAVSSSFWDDARRYMRYATAVYGQSMIRAAELDARGRVDGKLGRVTKEAIGHHISVPPEDIVLMDVDYDGDSSHLRHFVAVDHVQKKVVLSIRGTFNLAEVVLDVAGFTKEFCGGEAHSEMATMAERVWNVAGPTVCQLLERNQDYEFVVTGHSLGAGAACLLTILLEVKGLLPRNQKYRCFAYAPPPVYTPLQFAPKAVKATTSFVHQNDAVPYLSVHTVRHLLSDLRAVDDDAHNHMTSRQRYKVILGMVGPPKDLIATVLESGGKSLLPKQGAPRLYIPAEKTVWLKKDIQKEHGEYQYEILSPNEMMHRGIRVNPDMLLDHFPPRYEHALDHIEENLPQF